MNLAEKLKEFSMQINENEPVGRDSKVLLIDGLNSYLRCFASTPTMNDNGEHVGGLTGFLRSIGDMIRLLRPSRCVIIFDGKGGNTTRRKIYSEYKGTRNTRDRLNRTYEFDSPEQEQDNKKKQLIDLVEALTHLPVTVLSVDNVEADDVIAYLTNVITERGGLTYIASNDKDFLQLVNSSVRIYNPIKKKIYDVDTIVKEYGVHPNNFMIYRTIDGDDSDNIDGVKGVGLATLIKNFPEINNETPIPWEHIFTQCEEKIETLKLTKKKNAACERILENKDIITRNMLLMRLDDQYISGTLKLKILRQFDATINGLNKLALTRQFVRGRFITAFKNYDSWITSTFVPLTRYNTNIQLNNIKDND